VAQSLRAGPGTPSENKHVSLAVFYLLDDAQLWFHRLELNGGRPTWAQFIQLVNAWFRPPLTDSPIGELALLRRQGTVDEFSKWFIALSCRDTMLTEPQQVQLFITGLGDPLRTDIVLQQPATLDDVAIFARAYEQRNASRRGSTSQCLPRRGAQALLGFAAWRTRVPATCSPWSGVLDTYDRAAQSACARHLGVAGPLVWPTGD
jgi:hypothetical protein